MTGSDIFLQKGYKRMRKHFSAALALLLLFTGLLLLTLSCNTTGSGNGTGTGTSGDSSVFIGKDNMPQVLFVQGNELNLSGGKLTVNGKEVDLTDKDVQVTGYDKDKLGEQTLTVTYKGKSTSLHVTVVPRVQTAEQYLYFQGESMDAVSLRLKFTRDDGTSFTVKAGDEGLTITGFSSDATQDELTLTASYRKGTDDLSGSFTVSVVSPEVSFKKPRKTAYGSHETALDWLGASLTLKSADGKTTRNIAVTDLTASGFDPSVAGADAPSVTQTVHVSYLGREMATFDITVTYSEVSQVRDIAANLMSLDWSVYIRPDPLMHYPAGTTEEQGRMAMQALSLYESLSDSDAGLITVNEFNAIARLAVTYGYNTWQTTLDESYKGVFTVSYGEVSFDAATRADAQKGYDRLNAGEDARDEATALIYQYSTLLNNERFLKNSKDVLLYEGAEEDGKKVELTVDAMATIVLPEGTVRQIAQVLDKMLTMEDTLSKVPAGWSVDGLSAYAADIDTVYDLLGKVDASAVSDSSVYELVNSWRKGGDFFEILYRYYYGLCASEDAAVAKAASEKVNKLTDYRLPTPLKEISLPYVYGHTLQTAMQSIAGSLTGEEDAVPSLIESTMFLYYYRQAVEGQEKILATGDAMYIDLYNLLYASILTSMTTGDYGYYELNGTSSYDSVYTKVWDAYIAVWEKAEEDPSYVETEEFGTGVAAMFRAFVELRPNQQYNFLKALNYLYSDYHMPTMALYPDDNGLYSKFATYIYAYYMNKLGVQPDAASESTGFDIFTDLMIALEAYANNDANTFGQCMAEVQTKYKAWSGTDKDAFDRNLKFLYDRYMNYFAMFDKTTDADGKEVYRYRGADWGEYKEIVEQLDAELARAQLAQLYIDYLSQFTGESIPMYLAYISSYERIRVLADRLLACGNEDILRNYYYLPLGEKQDGDTLYAGVYDAEGNFTRYLTLLGINMEEYSKADNLRAFLRNNTDYFWSAVELVYPQIANPGTRFTFDDAHVNALMESFRALSPDERYLLLTVDSLNIYYGGLEAYYASIFSDSEAEKNLASALLGLEIQYISYLEFPDKSYTLEDGSVISTKEYLLRTWTSVKIAFSSLTLEERNDFQDHMGVMYDVYRNICDNLTID